MCILLGCVTPGSRSDRGRENPHGMLYQLDPCMGFGCVISWECLKLYGSILDLLSCPEEKELLIFTGC